MASSECGRCTAASTRGSPPATRWKCSAPTQSRRRPKPVRPDAHFARRRAPAKRGNIRPRSLPRRHVMTVINKGRILAEALPYIRAYHGKTLVIRFGGKAMTDAALKAGFARDVALLRSVGMKPIVVHGGGWRIDALMRQMGMESRKHRGLRVTDEQTLTVVEMALDELNQELTGLINTHGGRAGGLNGQDGRFIHA